MRYLYCHLLWVVLGAALVSPVRADVDPQFLGLWESFVPVRMGNSTMTCQEHITINSDGSYHAVITAPNGTQVTDGQFQTDHGHWTLTSSTGKSSSGSYAFQGQIAVTLTDDQGKVTGFWRHLSGPAPAPRLTAPSPPVEAPNVSPPAPTASPFGESRTAQAKRVETQGITFARQDQTGPAVQAFRQAVKLMPNDAAYQYNLGSELEDAGQYAEAVTVLRTAARLDPKDSETQRVLADSLSSLNRKPDAVAAYRRALQLNPHDAQAANNLGGVLDDLGRYPEAIAAYRLALKIDPHYTLAQVNLAQEQRNQQEKKKASK